ncbi:MAG: methylenetetrahydrofolate reductase [marine bacterium B5-7]|nr:MAG: methylenetetrahydrofolate reductase [marine bacterium B5-7]
MNFESTHSVRTNARETTERLARRRLNSTIRSIRERVTFSFEFFPPGNEAGERRLAKTYDVLTALSPDFTSITYGAGGSNREKSLHTVSALKARSKCEVAAHLTCIGSSRADIDAAIDGFIEIGIDHFVALRGDIPRDAGPDTLISSAFTRADQLVEVIRRRGDFNISVATYPEKHPESANLAQDITALKAKQDAGANRAITQFFFDTDKFLRFRDAAVTAGIRIPIIPGILPVHNYAGTARFAAGCGANIPSWVHELFNGLDDSPEVRAMVATTVATEQCARLIEHGTEHLHFYTLNQHDLASGICQILGLGSNQPTHNDDCTTRITGKSSG